MCGIIGSINLEQNSKGLKEISHRGPDGQDSIYISDANLFMGHVRLAIIDLSKLGSQPMWSSDNNFVIVFNGEIYNHIELRQKYLTKIAFKGSSDTETIVNLISEKGIGIVSEFNGIFAFCIYDTLQKKLYLCRDRFGVKPLYYSKSETTFSFCSEIRGLDKSKFLSIDRKNITELLSIRYISSPDTIYSNVRKVRPGEIISLDVKSLSMKNMMFYMPAKQIRNINFKSALEEYGYLLKKAIKSQLLADVEIGVLLSGGIDSAIICSMIQDISQKRVKTFSVGYESTYSSNELEYAKRSSEIIGTEHYDIKISRSEFIRDIEKIVGYVEEPLATTSVFPMYYLSKLASNFVKVVISGQGADEPLAGYRKFLAEKLYQSIPNIFKRVLSKAHFSLKNNEWNKVYHVLISKNIGERFIELNRVFSKNELEGLLGFVDDSFYLKYKLDSLNNNINDFLNMETQYGLSDNLLMYTDKITMQHSLECRVPMLDNDLVDFLNTIPTEFKLRFLKGKYIHKKFSESYLPLEIINRKKMSFETPISGWMNLSFRRKLYYDMLSFNRFSNIFNIKFVESLFNKNKLDYIEEKKLFLLYNIFVMMKNSDS